ncbi:hypothetical protein GCM10012278_05280 [Nonomuraea glycinis]|uniref:CobQ/CobB/MinD/ParA nucleotide binding domain-containing protein n=2 Tax=Nonomuraea glycinis TaxID=2047744 RepID=A0A918E340_9ACTN|nr:hypothetical protein GCM10012278_05280 [Nonomuraea glycinis]
MTMPVSGAGVPEHIYTWVDVNDHLAVLATCRAWPMWLLECDAFWDGLELTVRPDTSPDLAIQWLGESFGVGSLVREAGEASLRLDGVPGRLSDRLLPVSIRERKVTSARRELRWRERHIVRALGEPLPAPEAPFAGGVQIAALHSFKGGVGRTLHGVALAHAVAQRGGKVLLVDADLEAPGITWMFAAQGRRIDFSYEDFLALLHSSEDGRPDDAVTLGAAYLPNQRADNVIVLPTKRSLLDVVPPRLEPVDLLTPGRSSYFLTESLAELAVHLDARTVLVDLRAGTSELTAPVLLDPRVKRVFVTTINDQSLRGTVRTIRELGRRAPTRPEIDPPGSVIITQFRDQGHEDLAANAAAQLRDAVAWTLVPDEGGAEDRTVDDDVTLEPIFSPFQERLLALPASWDAVIDVIRRQQLPEMLSSLVNELSQVRSAAADDDIRGEMILDDLPSRRERLKRFSRKLVYAETAEDADFLATESLRNLLSSHRTEPPLCVVVGAKGSGKTFTQLQMCFRRTWNRYAESVGVSDVTLKAPLVPVFVSKNLKTSTMDRLERIQRDVGAFPDGVPASPLDLRDLIADALRSNLSDIEWRRVWLTCIARSVGLKAAPDNVELLLARFAAGSSRIFLVDGLEDLLQNFSQNKAESQALRVLLVDCLDWLRSLRGRPLGLVVFVRRDLVQAAIRQNLRQFFARYSEYELKWNPSEALRLALWAAQQSGALPDITPEQVFKATDQALGHLLTRLWGEKMGSTRSREARSVGWFLAALSDFNGQIQARDIMTFLAESAALSVDEGRWSDRLLAPAAMRKALVACSQDKIRAISEESPPVGALLKRLDELPIEQKRIPSGPKALRLASGDLEILAANGVVFREEDQYWIPEIFRHGLGFKAAGRPKILAIANLVRQQIT